MFRMPQSIEDVPRAEIGISDSCRVERYEASDKYFAYKMEENSSTSEHVLRMFGYHNRLNQVGVNVLDKIVIYRVL